MSGRSRMMSSTRMPEVEYSVTRLGGTTTQSGVAVPGGYDQTTPSLSLIPGALRDVLNFECSQSGGYARIEGYERYDGHPAPSLATYSIVQVSSFANIPAVGNTLTQATSGATGTVIGVSSGGAPYYVAVTKVTGAFDATHNVSVGATLIGTAVTTAVSVSSQLNAQYLSAAADVYRSAIGAVPGSGPILGVVGMIINGADCLYAFRNNAGGTAVNIYKASSSGWVQIPLFNIISFTAGNNAIPADGATLTQGGVTATIKRVMTQSGPLWTGAATGQFVITAPSGGNFAAGAATISGGATVTLSGAQTAITIQPNGNYVFQKGNLSGASTTRRIYGADGVNKCFEFDGTVYAPITTGLSPDAPAIICLHKNYLFVSYQSSMSYCGVGTPFLWNSVNGGGEIAVGDTITGLITLPGSQTTATLGVFLRSNTSFLYGLDPTTFNYVSFNTGTGALMGSVQNLADTFVLDDLGVITLKTTLNYGNFLPSTLTKNILPFIEQEREKLSCSSINRAKSQYRLFFSDGFGLWLTTVNSNYLGATVVLFPNPVSAADEVDLSTGGMVNYFGSSDGQGYVYQMDSGTSFDGANIDAHITLAWDAIKSPRILKRFRAASIEMQSDFYASINFGYQLGYGSLQIGQPANVAYGTAFSGPASWDNFTWDNFVWDGQTLAPTEVDMTGTAENVQVVISSSTNYISAYQVNSVIYHYTPRRGKRN